MSSYCLDSKCLNIFPLWDAGHSLMVTGFYINSKSDGFVTLSYLGLHAWLLQFHINDFIESNDDEYNVHTPLSTTYIPALNRPLLCVIFHSLNSNELNWKWNHFVWIISKSGRVCCRNAEVKRSGFQFVPSHFNPLLTKHYIFNFIMFHDIQSHTRGV